MSERKTRGRQRIPIKLIENKDDLLVSFSKRRVGVYKKASELSTLCGVDVGAIIFSPSGIPHSFFTPDFDSVVHGRRNNMLDQRRDRYGRVVIAESGPRSTILEVNKKLNEVIEQQEREEKREKHLDAAAAASGGAGEMGWWEVPLESLDVEQVKEQIEWFQMLKSQIKIRVQDLKNGASSSAAAAASPQHGDGTGAFNGSGHVNGGECFFPPPSLDHAYGGGGGTGDNVGDHYRFPPPPFDGGSGSGLASDQYLYNPPPPPHFDMCNGGGSGLSLGQNCYPPPYLNLFGGGGGSGIGHDHEQYLYPSSPPHGGYGYHVKDTFLAAAQGRRSGEPGPSR